MTDANFASEVSQDENGRKQLLRGGWINLLPSSRSLGVVSKALRIQNPAKRGLELSKLKSSAWPLYLFAFMIFQTFYARNLE